MNKNLSLLIALQSFDAEGMKLKNKKKTLPLLINELDESFERYSQVFVENKKKYEGIITQHKDLEGKLKKGLENLNKAKIRLGEVKTNKEYQAILKEIENVEIKNSEIETEILCLLEEIDKQRSEFQQEEKTKEQYEKKYEIEKNKLKSDMDSVDEKILTCTEQYKQIIITIPKDLLKRYEMIRALNNGLAVVSVWKGVCGGCHMNIPPQMYNELQKSDELLFCPNCNRIIYWQNQEQDVA